MFQLADGRQNVYQWDINVKLLLDESNKTADEVHFSARFSRVSLSVEVVHTENSSYVIIPNILLQKPNDIIAYSYITNADGSYTKYDTIIPVIARPKPSGYIYEEIEILTWKTLDDKIDDLGKRTADAVKYTPQELTDEQKSQARTNIGAVSVNEVPIATNNAAGVVKPVSKTDEMTQQVGIDRNGELFTVPLGGSGDMQKSVYDPNNNAKDIFKYADDAANLAVTNHASSNTAHSDIRELITGLTNRLNALADSDDMTLDQLSEIVAYIKSNKSLIDAITTSKISVSDIVDNLTTNNANKPLSAAQGVALKALIDGIAIPEKLPNPNALTFTGAVTGNYDGSEPLTVNIPSGGEGSGGTGGLSQLATVTLTEPAASIVLNFTAVEDIIISAQFKGGLDESTSTSIRLLHNYNDYSGGGYNHNVTVNLSSSVGYYMGYLYSQSLKMRGVLYAQTNINVAGNSTALRYGNIEDQNISSIRVFTNSETPFGTGTTITVYGGKL